jgi:hypothetical protein
MKSILTAFVATFLLASCSQQRFVVQPAFTDVSHIELLKTGMSRSEVAGTLEVAPIDFYYLQDGMDVYVYNYRLSEKRIPITNNSTRVDDSAILNGHIHGAAARTAGTLHYTEWRKLYVSFKGDKMNSMITGSGNEDANAVLLQMASIQALNTNPQVKLIPKATTDFNYVLPLNNKGEYISNEGVSVGTGVGQTLISGPADIAVIPREETTRSATVSDNFIISRRGKKKTGFSRSISYKRD